MIGIKKTHLLQLLIIISSIWLLYTFILSTIPFIQNVTLKGFDIYTTLANKFLKSPEEINKITIIAIDNETQKRLNLRLPWKRTFFVPIIEQLNEYSPKIVYLNFMFHGKTPYDETSDAVLAESLHDAGNIIIPYLINSEGQPSFPYKPLKEGTADIGYSNKIRDSDGIIRSFKPKAYKFYSIESAILNNYYKQPPSYEAQLRKDHSLYIHYSAYPEEFKVYTLIDLFNNRIPKEDLKDKIVLLGVTSDIIPDILNTPIGPTNSIYLTANTLLMHLSGKYIAEINPLYFNLVLLFLGFLAGIVIFRLSPLKSLFSIIGIFVCIFIIGFISFINGLFINYLNILLFLTLTFVITGFFRHIVLLEEKVTELRNANIEIKNAQTELIRQEQLATIGRLTSQILHEFSNPMDNLKSCLSMLKNDIEKEHKLKKFIDISYNEILRMSTIGKQLKSSYTPHAENLVPLSINEILQEVLDAARYRIQEKKITLSTNLDESLENINISKDKIKQVLLNMIINAIDAVGKGGTIEVSTLGDKESQNIIFKDNGCGIPHEDLSRLFTAFYTTKPSGEGSGLGLFISYEIIKAHKGEIIVESKVEEGTTFIIKLPKSNL